MEVKAGEILVIGQALRSQDGNSRLVFQEDGDLVVRLFTRVFSDGRQHGKEENGL